MFIIRAFYFLLSAIISLWIMEWLFKFRYSFINLDNIYDVTFSLWITFNVALYLWYKLFHLTLNTWQSLNMSRLVLWQSTYFSVWGIFFVLIWVNFEIILTFPLLIVLELVDWQYSELIMNFLFKNFSYIKIFNQSV